MLFGPYEGGQAREGVCPRQKSEGSVLPLYSGVRLRTQAEYRTRQYYSGPRPLLRTPMYSYRTIQYGTFGGHRTLSVLTVPQTAPY
jgi:hypothetical protein